MSLKSVVAFAVTASAVFCGVHTERVVVVDGHEARVLRASGDGLDDVASSVVRFGPGDALAACASWDVKENCCPAGCAAKKGTQWSKADEILRGCMLGLGCPASDVKSATVFMKCDCK